MFYDVECVVVDMCTSVYVYVCVCVCVCEKVTPFYDQEVWMLTWALVNMCTCHNAIGCVNRYHDKLCLVCAVHCNHASIYMCMDFL